MLIVASSPFPAGLTRPTRRSSRIVATGLTPPCHWVEAAFFVLQNAESHNSKGESGTFGLEAQPRLIDDAGRPSILRSRSAAQRSYNLPTGSELGLGA